MTAIDKAFTGSIPQIYERLMVPLVFAPYASDLAGRIAKARPRQVLETAAGTGVVTRELAARLPADTGITATDLNAPMLAQAKAILPDSRVEWRQADALALPFDDASFDSREGIRQRLVCLGRWGFGIEFGSLGQLRIDHAEQFVAVRRTLERLTADAR